MYGAVREHGAELESEVGGAPQLLHRGAEHQWHALPAECGVGPELRPAALDKLAIGRAKAHRRDDPLGRPAGALNVAGPVQRLEHGLREARRLFQD